MNISFTIKILKLSFVKYAMQESLMPYNCIFKDIINLMFHWKYARK